jgi:NAD(P)-dependent dehydrogenase (short-subunit alcohol dehydrogenase family)
MANSNKKVALITGANKGLGLEMAKQLGEQGMTVVLAGRSIDAVNAAAKGLREKGIDAHPLELDVTRDDQVARVADEIASRFGRLDVLVNNAGAMLDGIWMGNSATSGSKKVLIDTFDINFFAVVSVTRALVPLLKKSPAGRIVNMSSIMGSLTIHSDPTSPLAGTKPFAYDASKAALNAFTVHLAADLAGTPIKVNSAHPGWVKTDLGTEAAPMNVDEGAKTGVFLATLADDGPTGGFYHAGERLPW